MKIIVVSIIKLLLELIMKMLIIKMLVKLFTGHGGVRTHPEKSEIFKFLNFNIPSMEKLTSTVKEKQDVQLLLTILPAHPKTRTEGKF